MAHTHTHTPRELSVLGDWYVVYKLQCSSFLWPFLPNFVTTDLLWNQKKTWYQLFSSATWDTCWMIFLISSTLCQAILSRKLVAKEIHEVMSKVAELSVTTDSDAVRNHARQVCGEGEEEEEGKRGGGGGGGGGRLRMGKGRMERGYVSFFMSFSCLPHGCRQWFSSCWITLSGRSWTHIWTFS